MQIVSWLTAMNRSSNAVCVCLCLFFVRILCFVGGDWRCVV